MRKGLFGERVEMLNRAVQTEVAKHLFLVCNYRAVPAVAIHADARFFAWVQELYKVVVDCGDLVRNLRFIVPMGLCPENQELHTLIKTDIDEQVKVIVLLRSMIDHNNCVEGGAEQQAQIMQYENWMRKRIAKPLPETEEDYEVLSRALAHFADELYNNLNRLITLIGALPEQHKSAVINNWEEQILRWYTRPYGNVYYGYLAWVYVSRATQWIGRQFAFRDNKEKSRCLGEWIEESLRSAYLPVIREKKMLISACGALPELVDQLREAQDALDKFEEKVAEDGGDKKYFLNHLPDQLRETMRISGCSMLPQELILEDIERCFSKVASPHFDA